MDLIKTIEEAQRKTDLPDFNVGDTVKVFLSVVSVPLLLESVTSFAVLPL